MFLRQQSTLVTVTHLKAVYFERAYQALGLTRAVHTCSINAFLDNVDVGEYSVHGDLEAYSCEA